MVRERIEVRHVNGEGPRCGCEQARPSRLHVRVVPEDPDRDYFLCAECAIEAVEEYVLAVRQPSFGPCVRTDEHWHTDDCKYCTTTWPKLPDDDGRPLPGDLSPLGGGI